jgi:hypothetical protein
MTTSEQPAPKRYSVQLEVVEWRELMLVFDCIPMLPAKYRKIVDKVAVQTSRIREDACE